MKTILKTLSKGEKTVTKKSIKIMRSIKDYERQIIIEIHKSRKRSKNVEESTSHQRIHHRILF